MTLPISLTLFRHGESELNKAWSLAQSSNAPSNERELREVHTSKCRLSKSGVLQAQALGLWLHAEIQRLSQQFRFSSISPKCSFFTTTYVRGRETAAETGLRVQWKADERLGERNWGPVDRLPYDEHMRIFKDDVSRRELEADFWYPPMGGESILQVKMRLRQFLDMLETWHSCAHVFCSTHGELMWSARSLIEEWLPEELAACMLREDSDTQTCMSNCRVLQYTRLYDEHSTLLAPDFVRVRMVNPFAPDDPKMNLPWQQLVKRDFGPNALRAQVRNYKHFLAE